MRKIVVLVNKYPNILEPNVCVFIQQLVWSFADIGNECIVIAPAPIDNSYRKLPYFHTEKTENGNSVNVYHPKYFSFGQSGSLFQKFRVKMTTLFYERAVERVLKKEKVSPDVFYSHFLCPSGVVASRMAKKYGKPAFMACGEAIYVGDKKYGNQNLKVELSGLNGVIAVSSQNKDFVVNAGIVDGKIVGIFPNGYRNERFFPREKLSCRRKLGLPENEFIVGFCGSFDERKGILRLEQAIDSIDDVYFICAGKGKQIPTSERCLFAKPIKNEDLPYFYSALDVFVLPTQNEGCCNAIIEAIACGCPIVSSDRSFNYDICNNTNSILVDPNDISGIANAINILHRDSNLLKQLSEGSIKMSQKLSLNERAKKILEFMENA